MDKETIYDEQIAPLMNQIIEVCMANKIAMFSSFSLDLESGLICTTALLKEDHEPPDSYKAAYDLVARGGRPAPLMYTIRENGKVKEMGAILR